MTAALALDEVERLQARLHAMEQERKHLLAVIESLQEIGGTLQFGDIVQSVARRLGETFGLDRCSIRSTAPARPSWRGGSRTRTIRQPVERPLHLGPELPPPAEHVLPGNPARLLQPVGRLSPEVVELLPHRAPGPVAPVGREQEREGSAEQRAHDEPGGEPRRADRFVGMVVGLGLDRQVVLVRHR
jgi:hypothetical protein